jgi:hypothetical protein
MTLVPTAGSPLVKVESPYAQTIPAYPHAHGSHILTRERDFAGGEELSGAGLSWQGVVTRGKSIACRKCNYPCFRLVPPT